MADDEMLRVEHGRHGAGNAGSLRGIDGFRFCFSPEPLEQAKLTTQKGVPK